MNPVQDFGQKFSLRCIKIITLTRRYFPENIFDTNRVEYFLTHNSPFKSNIKIQY